LSNLWNYIILIDWLIEKEVESEKYLDESFTGSESASSDG